LKSLIAPFRGAALAVAIATLSLGGCVPYDTYPVPQDSQPHATLKFEVDNVLWAGDERAFPISLNGLPLRNAAPLSVRIGPGTVQLLVAESAETSTNDDSALHRCTLEFEAKAGRQYVISRAKLKRQGVYVFAVTSDLGDRLAECHATRDCNLVYQQHKTSPKCPGTPPTDGV
jgi:hypothetical protein